MHSTDCLSHAICSNNEMMNAYCAFIMMQMTLCKCKRQRPGSLHPPPQQQQLWRCSYLPPAIGCVESRLGGPEGEAGGGPGPGTGGTPAQGTTAAAAAPLSAPAGRACPPPPAGQREEGRGSESQGAPAGGGPGGRRRPPGPRGPPRSSSLRKEGV